METTGQLSLTLSMVLFPSLPQEPISSAHPGTPGILVSIKAYFPRNPDSASAFLLTCCLREMTSDYIAPRLPDARHQQDKPTGNTQKRLAGGKKRKVRIYPPRSTGFRKAPCSDCISPGSQLLQRSPGSQLSPLPLPFLPSRW